VNIFNFYLNFNKKSRSFRSFFGIPWNKTPKMSMLKVSMSKVSKTDIFLISAAVVVLSVALLSRIQIFPEMPKQNEIKISTEFEHFFGSDISAALIREFKMLHPDARVASAPQEKADVLFFDDAEFIRFISVAKSDGEITPAAAADAVADGDTAVASENTSTLASLSPYITDETGTERRAILLVSFMDLFFYNIDILQAAGSVRPPKTRTELLSVARAVTRLNRGEENTPVVYGLGLGLSREDPLVLRREIYPWVWADGGEVSASANTTLSGTVLETIAFFHRLDNEKLLAPGTFQKTHAQRLEEFAEGKIAMVTASARDIPFLRRNAVDINFGISTIPSAIIGRNRTGLSGIYVGISCSSTIPDEAWKFLAFLSGKRQVLAAVLDAVPGMFPDVMHGTYYTDDYLYFKAWEIFEAADIVEYSPDRPGEERISRLIWERLDGHLTTN